MDDKSRFRIYVCVYCYKTRNGDEVHVVPLYVGIANIDDDTTIRIDVNGYITTVGCSLD